MALPKVGVQVVVQDMAKFTRDIAGVEKTILKMSKNIESLAYLSAEQGLGGLANGFMKVALVAEAAAGPVGLIISVVQGLGVAFKVITNPIKKAWEAIKEFVGELGEKALSAIGSLAKKLFDFVNILPEIGDVIKRTISIAFGVLVRDTIRAFGDEVAALASGALEAASNFQTLELRLKGIEARDLMEVADVFKTETFAPTSEQRLALINYQEALVAQTAELDKIQKEYAESVQSSGQFSKSSLELEIKMKGLTLQVGQTRNEVKALTLNEDGLLTTTKLVAGQTKSFEEVEKQAAKQAKELLLWVTKLAIATPFGTEDIANVFTLARSYGFATEQAKRLTEATGNFAAGMGLDNVALERIIINLGQMQQQGKVTGRELTDLARGALVPTTRIFEMLGKEIGVTTAEARAMASTGKISVDQFVETFIKMSMKDFPNAAKNMTRTLAGLKEKISDFGKTFIGMFVLKPSLDVITGRLSDALDILMGNTTLMKALEALGNNLSKVFDAFFKFKIDEGMIDKISKFLFDLSYILDDLAKKDYESVREGLLKIGVPEWLIVSVENLKSAWDGFSSFIEEIKPIIIAGIGDILGAMGIELPTAEDMTGGIKGLADYLSQNASKIGEQIQGIINKIIRFITIVRTGGTGVEGVSAGLAAQMEEGLLPGGTDIIGKDKMSALDDIAMTIHNISVDMAGFTDKLSPMLINFVKINAQTVKEIAASISLIVQSITGKETDFSMLDAIEGFLNFISVGGQMIALILERIANAVSVLSTVLGLAKAGGKKTTGQQTEYGNMLSSLEIVGNEYLNPDTGKLSKQVENFTRQGVLERFKTLKKELVSQSVVPDMLSAIQKEFLKYFSLGGTMMQAVMNFVAEVIRRFREMYEEVVRGSIVPDMMEDINKEMTGGMDSAVKQSSQIMDEYLRMMQQGANYARGVPFASGSSSQNVYNNYSVQVDANYARTQSPVTIRYDVEAAIAAMML